MHVDRWSFLSLLPIFLLVLEARVFLIKMGMLLQTDIGGREEECK